MSNKTAIVYQGSINDILHRLCIEMTDALDKAGIAPTGVHVLAMMVLVAVSARTRTTSPLPDLGKMPSFNLLLSIFARNFTNTAFTNEEAESFKKEFLEMVQSLGGCEIPRGQTVPAKETVFVSPMSKEVH